MFLQDSWTDFAIFVHDHLYLIVSIWVAKSKRFFLKKKIATPFRFGTRSFKFE